MQPTSGLIGQTKSTTSVCKWVALINCKKGVWGLCPQAEGFHPLHPQNYPQVLEWFEDKDTQVFCEFLTRYPTLQAAQAASKVELEQFFRRHHVVQAKTINRQLKQIEQGIVLTEDVGIIEPLRLLVTALIAQLQVLLPSIATFRCKN